MRVRVRVRGGYGSDNGNGNGNGLERTRGGFKRMRDEEGEDMVVRDLEGRRREK